MTCAVIKIHISLRLNSARGGNRR